MSYVILGLLHIARMSLYDLTKAFESGVSLFYGSSAGSIKRSLNNLLSDGAIRVSKQEPGARGRKEYAITNIGRQRFGEWMRGEIEGDFDSAALARLYFLGFVEAEDRRDILIRMQERALADLERLAMVEREVSKALSNVPNDLRDVAAYQKATLDYGLSAMQHTYDWFTNLANKSLEN
ncbi:putative transcriptional regulator [Corynebacterium mustelae]|uniref:Putative transcriptional regulator n=1 Tax=Corynebacterium mustelae TaxID=571915 RepID=A0A0G3GWX4_9CORY|nr:PadR family transcriptional regulator [Corynebacterium mustelae]AKK05055.1 putative transcriptional regulator [Corynebacterium mustelae]